jgi:hypothetical protein
MFAWIMWNVVAPAVFLAMIAGAFLLISGVASLFSKGKQ